MSNSAGMITEMLRSMDRYTGALCRHWRWYSISLLNSMERSSMRCLFGFHCWRKQVKKHHIHEPLYKNMLKGKVGLGWEGEKGVAESLEKGHTKEGKRGSLWVLGWWEAIALLVLSPTSDFLLLPDISTRKLHHLCSKQRDRKRF